MKQLFRTYIKKQSLEEPEKAWFHMLTEELLSPNVSSQRHDVWNRSVEDAIGIVFALEPVLELHSAQEHV